MHIYPAAIGLYDIHTYSVAADRAAADRAAQVRKRLRRSAQSIESGADDPDALLLIGQWLNGSATQPLPGDEYSPSGRDPDFG